MQKTLIYVDINTKTQIRPSGSDAKTADYVAIERGQWQILCIQLVERRVTESGATILTPAHIADGTSLLLVGDNNFSDEDSLMFKSYQSVTAFDTADPMSNRFNIQGDWIGGELTDEGWLSDPALTTANPLKGQLSIRINADTAKFAEILGEKPYINTGLYASIKQYMQGIDNPTTIATFNFKAVNTIRDWKTPTELEPEGKDIVPFIDSYLRNPIELSYSVDGTVWTDTQSSTANYYRFRIANTSTTWSNPIPIKQGRSVAIQYSEDNMAWHDTALSTDVFIRTSTDDGATWSVGMKIGLTADDIEAIKTDVTNDVKDHVQTELADKEW